MEDDGSGNTSTEALFSTNCSTKFHKRLEQKYPFYPKQTEKKKKRHDKVKKHKAQRKTNKNRIIISKLECNIGGRKEE